MKSKIKVMLMVGIFACTAHGLVAASAPENWTKSCASCHGKTGAGDTVMGKKKGAKDYTSAAEQAKFTDAEATKAIKDGVPDKMKGFGDKLSAEEITALVAHVRSLKK